MCAKTVKRMSGNYNNETVSNTLADKKFCLVDFKQATDFEKQQLQWDPAITNSVRTKKIVRNSRSS